MPRNRTFNPVRPNVGIERAYQRRLEALVEAMHRSLTRWLLAVYRRNPPLGLDEAPVTALRAAVRRLSRYWQRRFNELAPELAGYFAKTVAQRSTGSLRSILKRGGFTVRFDRTRATSEVTRATISENVALIRSIAQQHLATVEGHVMRSAAAGRDLGYLAKQLEDQFGVSKRRAALIARDQNNKATAQMTRVRMAEAGIQEAIWVHSGGGKEPRPSHVRAGRARARFNLRKGWWDPDEREWILPGQLINCRCVSRPVVPGFS